jgi:hypothetical protein
VNKRKIKSLAIVFIVLFTFNTFGLILNNFQIPNTTFKNSKKPYDKDTFNEDTTNEEPFNIEPPKTADILEEQQNLNFSFNTNIEETWNKWYAFFNYNSTESNDSPDWMIIPDTKGRTFSFLLFLTNLENSSNGQSLNASNLHDMNFSYMNQSLVRENITKIVDHGYHLINGTCSGTVTINETSDAEFVIWNDWIENTNVSYDVWFNIQGNKSSNVVTYFVPTPENTQSDTIIWELQYTADFISDEYDASLEIQELENFTINKVLGYDGQYWTPITYTKNDTHIFINETYREFKIELETPNYVSIVYNDNLTYENNQNELRLYTTCKMSGNLTIQLRVPNGTIINYTKMVNKGDVVDDFKYKLKLNDTGCTGYLNVILSNNTLTNFGVKVCDIYFYKQCAFAGLTSNTSAFSQFFVIMAYFDTDYSNFLYALNQTDELNITGFELMDMAMVPNATVTYELGELQGELDYQYFGGFYGGLNITVYWTLIDLSEYQIAPGEYNMTYRASRPGYQSLEFLSPFIIEKANATIRIVSVDDTLTIEEDFIIVLELYDNQSGQNYLMTPVALNLTFINNDTKEVAVDGQWPVPAIQSITIQDTMDNETPPGVYNLTFTIDSEYYQGRSSKILYIAKKALDISVDHDTIIRAGSNTNFTWSLEDNNFQGNRANMSLQIIVDGELFRHFNLTSNSTGWAIFNFGAGEHNITYRIISMFYEAEETVIIQALAAVLPDDDDDDDDDDDKEENILLLMIITLILIGVSILAIFMVISRHKVKAQRELESELIALKTKTAATEQKISLIETQISEIASIYWVLVVHSEQGVTIVEIADFKFENVIDEEQKELIGKGMLRDSALIGGFLTAIRNFSRETSGTSLESQPVFNSQTDYSTIVNDNEIHRRILEGSHYFMAFVSSRGTMEISDVLSFINSKFELAYGEAVKKFEGAISPFRPFEEVVVEYLHEEIKALQKKLIEERLVLEQHERHLREVQEKIGIKPKKLK